MIDNQELLEKDHVADIESIMEQEVMKTWLCPIRQLGDARKTYIIALKVSVIALARNKCRSVAFKRSHDGKHNMRKPPQIIRQYSRFMSLCNCEQLE